MSLKGRERSSSCLTITAVHAVPCGASECLSHITTRHAFTHLLHQLFVAVISSLACMLLVYMENWPHCNNHQRKHLAVSPITTFFTSIFAQIVRQVTEKRNNATPVLRAMHAVCPGLLALIAFDLKKEDYFSFVAIKAGCMQLPTATAASAKLCNVGELMDFTH